MLARIPECPQDTVIDPRSTKRCRRIIPRGIIPDIIVSPIPLLSKWFTNHVAIDPLCFNNLMCPLAAFTCMSINFNIALLTKLFRWCSYANLFWVDFFLCNSYYIAKVSLARVVEYSSELEYWNTNRLASRDFLLIEHSPHWRVPHFYSFRVRVLEESMTMYYTIKY